MIYTNFNRCGEIGRRAGFRFPYQIDMRVRVSPPVFYEI